MTNLAAAVKERKNPQKHCCTTIALFTGKEVF
jgi:hypothetical protein